MVLYEETSNRKSTSLYDDVRKATALRSRMFGGLKANQFSDGPYDLYESILHKRSPKNALKTLSDTTNASLFP